MVVEEEIYRRGGGISKKIARLSERGRIVRSFPVCRQFERHECHYSCEQPVNVVLSERC